MKNKIYIVLSLIVVTGAAFVRFYDLPSRVIFTEDHALFHIFAYKNIIYHERLVCGPSIGGVWATFPPTFYYLTTWIDKVTNFSYLGFHIMTAVANLITVLLMILLLPKVFGRRVALLVAFIYSFSFFAVSQAIVGTNPGLVPPLLILFSSTAIFYFRDRQWWGLPIAVFSLSLMTHLHVTALFVAPAFALLFFINLRRIDLSKKGILAVVISVLIILYIGVRPHYLQNKAFGNQNFLLIKKALLQGPNRNEISKLSSSGNFLASLGTINNDVLLPNGDGYQEQTVTSTPMAIFGNFLTIAVIGFAIFKVLKELKKTTAVSIISLIFLSNLICQTVVPMYPTVAKPIRWLDSIYIPAFFSLLAILITEVSKIFKNRPIGRLAAIVLAIFFLVINGNKWLTDQEAGGRLKLKTVVAKASVTAKYAANETNINLVHLGNVNLNPTWPFAFALWKETGNDKYLRTLLWNIDPKRNEPFYIFSDKDDNTRKLSETIANSYQDNPANLKIDLEDGFLVEKIYNQNN